MKPRKIQRSCQLSFSGGMAKDASVLDLRPWIVASLLLV
jgi:hypothetical protein